MGSRNHVAETARNTIHPDTCGTRIYKKRPSSFSAKDHRVPSHAVVAVQPEAYRTAPWTNDPPATRPIGEPLPPVTREACEMDSGEGEGPAHGIVLAGGFPWSDSPLDRLASRQLLPVAHHPLITYALRWLRRGGIQDVVVCLNAATRAARSTMTECGADRPGLSFREDVMPRGSAGCA